MGCAHAPGPPAAHRSDSRASVQLPHTGDSLPGPVAWPEGARAPGVPRRSAQGGQGLLVVGDVTRLRDRGDHLPADYAAGVNDERTAHGHATVLVEHAVTLRHVTVRPEVRQQPELEAFVLRPDVV